MDFIILTCVSGVFFQRSIGAYQVAHFLREHGYTVQVIDFTDYFTEDELLAAVNKFITKDTLAIGLSTTFYTPSEGKSKFIRNTSNKFDFIDFPANILHVIESLKKIRPDIKVVIGGAKSEAGKSINHVDAVIHGYAEDKVLEYLEGLPNNKKKKRSNTFNISTNLEFPYIAHNDPVVKKFSIEKLTHRYTDQDNILKGETLPIEVSRGCIFKCKFCAFPLNGKSKLDYLRDPILIKEELQYNYEKYGTTHYFLSDDTFNDSTTKIEQIHKVVTSLPFKIKFTTYLRLDLLHAHQEQISMLEEMGLASPFFGIESLNQKSASSIGKGMNVDRAKDFLNELHYNHWKEKIPITCSFIIGLPYETKETIQNTFEWAKSSPVNSIFFPLSLDSKTFYKSEFNTNYAEYGYRFDKDSGYWENENFNYNEATELSEKYNEELMRKSDIPSSWFLMTLLNHGYTLDEATSIKNKDLNYKKIFRYKLQHIKEYKRKLFDINT
jgi:radical SAM superfamily enzyme YgiQ (UPF0313 family)